MSEDSSTGYKIEEMNEEYLAEGNLSEILIIVAVVIAIGAGVAGFMYYNKQKKDQAGATPGSVE